jgi:hypothetical protein
MTRFRSLLAVAALALAVGVPQAAASPSCETLVDELRAAFDDASAYVVGVTVEQGTREIAYERARQTRAEDGSWTSETLERRGLRRPGDGGEQDGDATFGDVPISCEGHELRPGEDGQVVLALPGQEGEGASITGWSLRFEPAGERWLPRELIAEFEARVVFVPVRGRFVTTLDEWRFEGR